jgi:membrane fusion protein (multidrug efflux system)
VLAAPERRSLEDLFLEREATLTPIVTTMISTRQEGVILQVHPEVGDAVHEGDPLAELDETDVRLRVAELRATVHKAKVTLAERQRAWKRAEELYGRRVISEGERDDQQLALDRARAEMEEEQARLDREVQYLKDHRIVAPFPGVVSQLQSDVGSYVQRGDPILELKRVDWIIALCTVSERDLRHIHEGATVRVALSAFPGRTFEGLVWKIVPDALLASRSFPVKILLRNPQIELKPGMSAQVAFVRQVDDALLVPKDAVAKDGDESVVWVIRDGKAERRVVELGTPFGDRWHVRSGLATTESVIVTGNEFLEPGAAVRVVDLPPPGPPTVPAARRQKRVGGTGS